MSSTINEVIRRVGSTKPNAIEDEIKARWLMELDGRVFREVTGRDEPDMPPVQQWPGEGDRPLLIPRPYDSVYDLWLTAMVCFALGEYSDYNNTAELFDQTYQAFCGWWRREHVPKQTVQIQGV